MSSVPKGWLAGILSKGVRYGEQACISHQHLSCFLCSDFPSHILSVGNRSSWAFKNDLILIAEISAVVSCCSTQTIAQESRLEVLQWAIWIPKRDSLVKRIQQNENHCKWQGGGTPFWYPFLSFTNRLFPRETSTFLAS